MSRRGHGKMYSKIQVMHHFCSVGKWLGDLGKGVTGGEINDTKGIGIMGFYDTSIRWMALLLTKQYISSICTFGEVAKSVTCSYPSTSPRSTQHAPGPSLREIARNNTMSF